VGAAVVFKSISPSGVVEFSDQLPPATSKLVEEREISKPAISLQDETPLPEPRVEIVSGNFSPPSEPLRPTAIVRDEADEARSEHARSTSLTGHRSFLDVLRARFMAFGRQ